MKQQEDQLDRKIKQAEQAIKDKQVELAGMDDMEDLKDEAAKIQKQIKLLSNQIRGSENEIAEHKESIEIIQRDTKKHQRTKKQIQDVSHLKLRACFQQDRSGSVEKVYYILKRYKNEGKLQGSVHGPLAAELTCSSRQDIVENCIGGRYLLAFVFTDKRDLDLLYTDHRQHARKIAYLLNETIHIPPRTFNPNVNGIALKFADQLLVEPKDKFYLHYVVALAFQTRLSVTEMPKRKLTIIVTHCSKHYAHALQIKRREEKICALYRQI